MVKRLLITFILAIASISCGFHSPPTFSAEEFPVRSVSVDGVKYNYRLYVPANRPPDQKLPVMLYLHGSNRRGDDNNAQVADLADVVRAHPANFPYAIVMVQCRANTFWAGPMMNQSIAALDQTVKELDGDPDRLYLAGYSMGGFGTWQTAVTHPDKFAALVVVAGGIQPTGQLSVEDQALLSPQVKQAASAPDPFKAFAEPLAGTPVWIVHGSEDKSVPVTDSQRIAAALKAVGNTDVNYFELPGVGHGSLADAFGDAKLAEWLAKRHR